jgi:two-component system sensor histidine kinase VicK
MFTELSNLCVEFSIIREIAEASTEGVIIYSLEERKVIYANDIAAGFLGLNDATPSSDLIKVLESVLKEDKTYLKEHSREHDGRPILHDIELHFSKDHKEVYFCCNRFFVSNGSNVVIFMRDISKAKQHEDYLVEFGTRKNTVLDTLTHHISGALNLMQHLSKEAQKYITSSDKNLSVYLGLLQENSNQCLLIINDLLKNEHKQSPSIFVKNTTINLVDKVWIVYDEFQQSYSGRRFEFKASAEFIQISTDEIKLLQVVNNLVSNAIKFSDPHSPITISIFENATEVIVSVTDTGVGIPDSLKPLIFERQLATGRTGQNGEKSIGLGLSICKNLIHLLKGRIWFESKEGEGSVFSFSLPKK